MKCPCKKAVYDDWASVAFDPDVYDCIACGHINGGHAGPECECSEEVSWWRWLWLSLKG